jgi:hypothetical protein
VEDIGRRKKRVGESPIVSGRQIDGMVQESLNQPLAARRERKTHRLRVPERWAKKGSVCELEDDPTPTASAGETGRDIGITNGGVESHQAQTSPMPGALSIPRNGPRSALLVRLLNLQNE